MSTKIKILNWNVGGAKFLELPSGTPRPYKPGRLPFRCREEFQVSLNEALRSTIVAHGQPEVICLQEIVQYEEKGNSEERIEILDEVEGYKYYPLPLIDTLQFGAEAKWLKVMRNGKWVVEGSEDRKPFFSQGNGFLVKTDCEHFPMWCLPKCGVTNREHPMCKGAEDEIRSGIERVDLHPGLYFGDRNTEPRAAFVLHLVLHQEEVLDVFVVNLHLTTLKGEREGIPDIDEKASEIRINQLKVILDNCVSQYNGWRRNRYVLGGNTDHLLPEWDTTKRYNPVWILAGDFNFTRESAEYQYLKRRNFVDLVVRGATKASGLGQPPTIAVDYIFAGPRHYSIDPKQEEQEQENSVIFNDLVKVSDHYPVIAYPQIMLSGE